MAKVILRPMTRADIADVQALEVRCFNEPWPPSAFIRELSSAYARYLVARQGAKLLGYAGMWMMVGEAYVTNLAVAPEVRRRGLGRRMMAALMDSAYDAMGVTSLRLHVRSNNEAARTLYRSMGFTDESREPGYYENGEDAVVMVCADTGPWRNNR